MGNIENGATQAQASTTLHFRRMHPGGGPLGRCSYGIPGVPGIVVFDVGLFANGVPPQTIELPFEMAKPQARKVAGVTSAVVAQANNTVAVETGTAIAEPAKVAEVVAQGATVVVGQAQAQASKGNAKGRLVGKASKGHAEKVG